MLHYRPVRQRARGLVIAAIDTTSTGLLLDVLPFTLIVTVVRRRSERKQAAILDNFPDDRPLTI